LQDNILYFEYKIQKEKILSWCPTAGGSTII